MILSLWKKLTGSSNFPNCKGDSLLKFSLLFFRRHWKLYSNHFFFTFLTILIVCLSSLGGATVDRITIASFLDEQSNDLEVSVNLKWGYSSANFSDLSTNQLAWLDIRSQWARLISNDYSLVFIDYLINDSLYTIGIDFADKSYNQKLQAFPFSFVNFFKNNISLDYFQPNTVMPFDISIIFTYEYLTSLDLSSFNITSENSQIGYAIDFKSNRISSPSNYKKRSLEIIESFETNLIIADLVIGGSIEDNSQRIESVLSFKETFDSLILLVSFIAILLALWLNEFFTDNFINRITPIIDKLINRGLDLRRKNSVTILLPSLTDLFTFLVIGIALLILNFIISLNLIPTAIILGLFCLILTYKNYRKYKDSNQVAYNSKSIVTFIVILLIVSLLPILVKQFTYELIPDIIFSYLVLFSQTVQYFILTLLITELFIQKVFNNIFKKNKINNLVYKLISLKENWVRHLFHSTLLLIWGTTIITGSFQTFTVNYDLNYNLEHPTDMVVETDVFLFNVSQIQTSSYFAQVLPISHTQENFFVDYDLYLMDFTILPEIVPNYKRYYDLTELEDGITYMSKDFAKKFHFEDGDFFLTKFGDNGSSLYVNQEIQTINYFPLIKQIENRPFIVSSYNKLFCNISSVTTLYLNLNTNITKKDAINTLDILLNTEFQLKEYNSRINYTPFILVYQLYFILIVTINILLCLKQLLNQTMKSFATLYQRGMRHRDIMKRQFDSLFPSLLIAILLGVSLGFLYLKLQLLAAIYTSPLYAPIRIAFGYSFLLILIIPILYVLTIFSQNQFNIDK